MEQKDFRFYDRFFRTIKKPAFGIVSRKLQFTGEELPSGKGPLFILCNHNTDLDFILLAGVSREPLDYVATETMLRIGVISRIAAKTLKPILHDKGAGGVGTLKQIIERIRAGRNVVLFPEGNRSFDGKTGEISGAIGKIVKTTGATLVVYRLSGGYLTSPRWGHGFRKGRMQGHQTVLLSPDEIRKMDNAELLSVIRDGLYTDAYEEQKAEPIRFKSRVRAEYLESLMFVCPSCKNTGMLHSKKDRLLCECGYRLSMDEFGILSDKSGNGRTIPELFTSQKELLKNMAESAGDSCLFKDNVTICRLTDDHRIVTKQKGLLSACNSLITINSDDIPKENITAVDIVQRNRLIIHVKNSDLRYEITGSRTFNAVKYRILFETVFS